MDSLAGILQILNKPIHFFFIGISIILFAPADVEWVGFILLASVLASAIEFAYSKATAKRASIIDIEQKKTDQKKEERLHLDLYNGLHEQEKYMVDYCISRNEYVYEISQYGPNRKKHITGLALKGFGKPSGGEIIFNGDTFFTILRLKGEALKSKYEKNKQQKNEEE